MNSNNSLLIVLLLFMANTASGQELGFTPKKGPDVAEHDYKLAVRILDETYESIENDNGEIIYADYWNLAYAYTLSDQPREKVKFFLEECKRLDPAYYAELFNTSPGNVSQWEEYLGAEVIEQLRPEETGFEIAISENISPKIYCTSEYTDLQCVLAKIWKADQHHRGGFGDITPEQKRLDIQNQESINQLFARHQTYLGIDMVGRELSHVMWAVIQHSNLAMMKQYLPVIQEALKDEQLPGEGTLKLLVDRICSIEHGVQLYGSQGGISLASGRQKVKLSKEYNIELPANKHFRADAKSKTRRHKKNRLRRHNKSLDF